MSKELPIIVSKGLAGVTSKDNPDFETWRKTHEEELHYYSFDDAKRIYKNGLFVNKYGKEKFNSLSPEERDSLYESDAVNTYLQDNYSEDERFEEINNLTLEGKRELINSGYLNSNELKYSLENSEERAKQALNSPIASFGVPGTIMPHAAQSMGAVKEQEITSKNQEYTLNNIIEKDKKIKLEIKKMNLHLN